MREHTELKDQADRHMVTNICTAGEADTANDFIEKMRKSGKLFEAFAYIYIIDSKRGLIGAISVQKILIASPHTRLGDIMEKKLVMVHHNTDREKVAMLAIQHKLKAIPVVDHENKLLGAIPENGIYQILHEEHTEDMLRTAGFRHAQKEGTFIDVLKARTLPLIRARMPWLLLGLVGGMLATSMVSIFEKSLEKHVVLAFFIPVIVYMADAVGTQTESLYLRMYDMGGFHFKSYLMREIKVAAGIGLISAILLFGYTLVFFHERNIAIIVGTATFTTIFVSVFVATLIPSIIAKMKKDPAVGSGPFATVIQDILSLAIYFAIALWILG